MQLIICEKPSVAQSIAAVLGAKDKKNGYFAGTDILVSWCFGHLAGMASAEKYDEKYARWRYDDLPILPENWQLTVSESKQMQFAILQKLLHRSDVETVVNACDAGREGELIFRNVMQLTGCGKPVLRLWVSSMEDYAIQKGFGELRPESDFHNLYRAALCRAQADWLVGINATRLFSVLYHRMLNVGRVMSPTLALIVQREEAIRTFHPEAFYTVNLISDGFTAATKPIKDKAEAERMAADCKGQAVIASVESRERIENPPALYDLTTLQRDANRLLGYTAQQTLDYTQALYEKKLCTYPRTDSRFLTDDMISAAETAVMLSAVIFGKDAPGNIHVRQVCDSKKVHDHHAIIPTMTAGKADISALPAGEREILKLICRQVLMAVSSEHRYTETTVTLGCAGHNFTTKGKTVLVPGWKAFLPQEQTDNTLPDFHENQAVEIADVTVKEGKTTPPRPFTEDTLLSAMETAGNVADAERRGLGTPATRAGILEKLVRTGFIERKKAQKASYLLPTHAGCSLITVLPETLRSPLLTAQWEQQLVQIEHGELSPEVFMDGIKQLVCKLVQGYTAVKGAEVLFPSGREVIGKCPRCGGDVTESKNGYFCEDNDCRFGLWRDNKFLVSKRIALNKRIVAALLKDGQVGLTGLYSERTGKTYDAVVVLEDFGKQIRYRLEFSRD